LVDLLVILTGIGTAPSITPFFLNIDPPAPSDLLAQFVAFLGKIRPEGVEPQAWSAALAGLQSLVSNLNELEKEHIPDPEHFPEEFEDACLYTLMRNPVKLPKVKDNRQTRVDRSTLAQLNGQDPVTATPFNPEEAVPDVELKAKIDQWWKEYVRTYRQQH
jgi:hypothetical protein